MSDMSASTSLRYCLLVALLCAAAAWADPAALERAFIKTVADVKPSVVTIAVPCQHEGAHSVECAVLSGVVVKPEGYIVSLSNLLNGCQAVDVTFADGSEGAADLVGYDPVYGLGVLKVDDKKLKAIRIADQSAAPPGSWAIMVGNAYGLSHSISWGIVSAVRRGVQVQGRPPVDMIQMTTPVNPGDSGCAVVNLRGELVGLASSRYTGSGSGPVGTGISFAVPVHQLMESLEQIVDKGRVARGWLGVGIMTVYLPRSERHAVKVLEVVPDSPGQHAGLQPNDLITALNRTPIGSADALEAEILLAKPDTTVQVEVLRHGRRLALRPTLGEWRPTVARKVGADEALVFPSQPDGRVQLSSADRNPGNAVLRRQLLQMHQQLLQLLRESER